MGGSHRKTFLSHGSQESQREPHRLATQIREHTDGHFVVNSPIESRDTVLLVGQINFVVRDVSAASAFYRLLGLPFELAAHPDWAAHHEVAILPNGTRLELDSAAFASTSSRSVRAARLLRRPHEAVSRLPQALAV